MRGLKRPAARTTPTCVSGRDLRDGRAWVSTGRVLFTTDRAQLCSLLSHSVGPVPSASFPVWVNEDLALYLRPKT